MENDRGKVYKELNKNAKAIKEALLNKNFNLAEVDRLFNERNKLFLNLKGVFVSNDIDQEEITLIENMINDNNELLELILRKKSKLEKELKKKEMDAKKITSYLKG